MTRARHRLFDAKRRDGWHTYMQGAELYVSQKIPIPKSAVKVYAADWIRAEPDVGSFEVIRGNLPVHDYPCPTRMAIVGGRVVLDDGDIGSEEFVVVPMMVEMPLVSKPTDGNAE